MIEVPAVALSLALAGLAALVGLELAGRSRGVQDPRAAGLWILAAAAAMGSGVWAMHFVGMSAMAYPFEPGFALAPTLTSWAIALLACAPFLWAASMGARLGRVASWWVGPGLAVGVAAMHFVGVRAMTTTPAPAYDWRWIAGALACASVGCGLGLVAAAKAKEASSGLARIKPALLVGAGLASLHYLAMESAVYAPGTVCAGGAGRVDVSVLSWSVGAVALAFLGLMWLVSQLEGRARSVASALSRSLALAQKEVRRAELSDIATGLPNRLAFQKQLDGAAARAVERGGSLALLLVEVDGLSQARRGLTTAQGDAMLLACAKRVSAAAGRGRVVASVGGGQFMALAELPGAPDTAMAVRVAERVAAEMRAPVAGLGEARLTASVGIALAPGQGAAERLPGEAGVALDAARARGGDGYAFFEPGMDSEAHAAAEWLGQLRLAIEKNQFVLHYQPKIHAKTGQVAGVEALIRWRHPERGMVGPMIFIPIAERFGLIDQIGDWVVGEAARQMGEWADLGIRMRVAVNVSPGQLLQTDFAERVDAALGRHAVDPALLTCEITESGAMQDSERTMGAFKQLRELGVELSIDDFGTGYSSLSHLRKIPLRQLKIDRSFVADLADNADARSIVSAIIVMAHALRLEVVAEGVETASQRDILLGLGCDKLQGFLFAKPMSADVLTAMMSDIESTQRQFRDSLFTA